MKFQANKSYPYRLAVDSTRWYEVAIIRRTAKSVWISDGGDPVKRCKIYLDDGNEYIYPDGKYSMCPIVRSN